MTSSGGILQLEEQRYFNIVKVDGSLVPIVYMFSQKDNHRKQVENGWSCSLPLTFTSTIVTVLARLTAAVSCMTEAWCTYKVNHGRMIDVIALRTLTTGGSDCNSSYLNLSDQDICDASQHSHKVKHIPCCFQVVLKDEGGTEIRLHREGSFKLLKVLIHWYNSWCIKNGIT